MMTREELHHILNHLGPFFRDEDPYDVLYDIRNFDPEIDVDLEEVQEFLATCRPSGL